MPLPRLRSVLAQMLAWPMLTGVPALLAAAATRPAGRARDRARRRRRGGEPVACCASLRLVQENHPPLHEIAAAARRVASRGDYSVRASKVADDETGIVADAFNDMLTEIELGMRSLDESQARYRCLVDAMAKVHGSRTRAE